MAGTHDRALLAEHVERARTQRARVRADSPVAVVDATAPYRGTQAQLIDERGKAQKVARARAPGGPPIFGATDVFVDVRGEDPLASVLRIPLEHERVAAFVPGSLRIARWDETGGRFRLLAASAYDADRGYVYGRITRPGIYTALGLPSDERVLATLDVIQTLGGWLDPTGPDFVPKVCGLILCAEPGTGPGGPGDLCAMCLGGGGRGVDLDLFGVIEMVPGRFVPPVGWAPRPCPTWESAGPTNIPGRITSLAIHPAEPKTLYAGAAAGGVFRTSDSGTTWHPLWHQELSLAIGALVIAPSERLTVYAATGEWGGVGNTLLNHFPGVGVYRSTDGGADWDLLAPIPSTQCNAVCVDPVSPDRAYVAGNMALHRTTDGGKSWDITAGNTQGIFDGFATDVVVDPLDPQRLYIGVDQVGVFRSSNGGASWQQLSGLATGAAAGSPKIALGRDGPSGTKFVAVLMDLKVYTSTNGGNTPFSQKANLTLFYGSGPGWNSVIAVDPTDENVILAGHTYLERTTNGGSTWTPVAGGTLTLGLANSNVHLDMQAVLFDPTDHDRVYVASDGGVSASIDNGKKWKLASDGLVTTQCWTVAASPRAGSGLVTTTTQDNACYLATGTSTAFQEIRPFEGGIVEFDRDDRLFAATWMDVLRWSTDGGATWTAISPPGQPLVVDLAIARQDPRILLATTSPGGTNYMATSLYRSTDRGVTWSLIFSAVQSPTTAAFAPSDDQHAYVGGPYGQIFHSANAGQAFSVLATSGLPGTRVNRIAVDWTDPKRFYVAFGGLGVRHLWRGDIGASVSAVTWTDVSGRIPAASLPDLAITGLALHPTLDETIYVSNILGVYRSVDGGESWAPYDEGIPNSFVSDLDIRQRGLGAQLHASTMGRGIYRRGV